jgi:dCTP diphosphatase
MSDDLRTLQERLAEFASERDWDQFHSPKNLVMALSGEVGELTELFQWLTDEQSRTIMGSKSADSVKEEVADVYLYLARLAHVLDIDLQAEALKKISLNESKYPVSVAKGNAVKYNRRESK